MESGRIFDFVVVFVMQAAFQHVTCMVPPGGTLQTTGARWHDASGSIAAAVEGVPLSAAI